MPSQESKCSVWGVCQWGDPEGFLQEGTFSVLYLVVDLSYSIHLGNFFWSSLRLRARALREGQIRVGGGAETHMVQMPAVWKKLQCN